GSANLDLDLFGRALSDQQVVLAFQVIHDGFIHLITRHPDGTRIHDAREGNDGDIGRSAANIDHHVSTWFRNGKAGSNGCHHRLFYQVNLARLCAVSRVHDGALFYLGNFRRDTNHDARMHHHLAVVRLLNEVVQHLLGDLEVGDYTVFHRLDGHDIAGRAAQHLFGFLADGFDFACVFVDGDDRWLVDDDALALGVDQRVGCA